MYYKFSYLAVVYLCLAFNCQAKPLIVYFDWFFNPHHAPLIIAQQKGFFKRQGIEVRLVSANGSEEGSNQVAAGHADIAVSKQSSHLIRVINKKMPLVRIATIIDKPLECLITSPNIKKIANLKGKRIGFTSSNIEFATFSINTILKFHGVDPTTVTLVPILSHMGPALINDKVDAIFSAYRTYELEEIRQHQPGANVFYYEENGIPSYEQVILVANSQGIERPELVKFINAIKESCEFIKSHPEEAWKSYISYVPDQNTSHEKRLFFQLVSLFVKDPSVLSVNKYEEFANYLSKSDTLKGPLIPISQYAVDLLNR